MSELSDLVIVDPMVQRAYDQGYDRGYRAGLREQPEPPKQTTRERLLQRSDELFDKSDELWRAGDTDPDGRGARLERMAIDLQKRAAVADARRTEEADNG